MARPGPAGKAREAVPSTAMVRQVSAGLPGQARSRDGSAPRAGAGSARFGEAGVGSVWQVGTSRRATDGSGWAWYGSERQEWAGTAGNDEQRAGEESRGRNGFDREGVRRHAQAGWRGWHRRADPRIAAARQDRDGLERQAGAGPGRKARVGREGEGSHGRARAGMAGTGGSSGAVVRLATAGEVRNAQVRFGMARRGSAGAP